VINEVKKIFIHSVNENINTCSAMHVRSMLLRIMILKVQKTHLNEVYFLKDKISQFKSTTSRRTNVKTLIYKDCNVVKK